MNFLKDRKTLNNFGVEQIVPRSNLSLIYSRMLG